MKKIISDNAPKAVGPYSHAVQTANGFIFLSGQLGLDPTTGKLKDGLIEQTKQSLANLEVILKEAGYSKNDVVKTLVLLSDIKDFSQVNEVYANFFRDHKPARSAFQVGALPLGGLVEIELVAYKK